MNAGAAIVASLCALVGLFVALHHPIAPAMASIVFVLWTVAVFACPLLWLGVLPAVMPLLGFASWTGWLMFEEWDLVALGAAAGGYARLAVQASDRRSPRGGAARRRTPAGFVMLALFLGSTLLGAARGMSDAGPGGLGWFAGYYDAANSLRVLKPLALACLLAPLLRKEVERDDARACRWLATGLAIGVAFIALGVVQERLIFTGLLDFVSDYRATGPFWEMHVGGAPLDGALLLGLPFALWLALRSTRPWTVAAGVAIVGLVLYACLATFSRGVYLALPVSVAAFALLSRWRHESTADGLPWKEVVASIGCCALAAALFHLTFRHGGYRALGAVLVTLTLGLWAIPQLRLVPGATLAAGVAAGLGASAAAGLLAHVVPLGAYVVLAAAAAATAGCALTPARPLARAASYTALVALAANVALHWGGAAALIDAALALACIVVLIALNARAHWVATTMRGRVIAAAVMTILAGTVAVFSAGAYMGERFASAGGDFRIRLAHWGGGLAMLDGPMSWLVGKGLGRFPANYFFTASDRAMPGSYRHEHEGERDYLRLSGPRYSASFGDLFRIAQRLTPEPGAYVALLELRAAQPLRLHVEVCEKHLIYADECAIGQVDLVPSPGWQRVSVPLDGTRLSPGPWYARKLAFFSLAVETPGRAVELSSVSVIGPHGKDVIANGRFEGGMARWFFTSDRYHWPWHIENVLLAILFDQGLIGVATFAALLAGVLWRLIAGRASRHPIAPVVASALLGFLVVGALSTIIDVARVAFVFYTLMLWALVLPEAAGARASPQGGPRTALRVSDTRS